MGGGARSQTFEATGDDPSLLLTLEGSRRLLALQPGRYRLQVELSSTGRPIWRPRLYLDLGGGFSEAPGRTFGLAKVAKDQWAVNFSLDAAVRCIRLDPTERGGGIVDVGEISISRLAEAETEAEARAEVAQADPVPASFCAAPFIQTVVTATGLMHPCCAFNDNRTSVSETPPVELWNGQAFSELRGELSAGARPAPCLACYAREDAGAVSVRNVVNNAWEQLSWGNLNGETLADLRSSALLNEQKAPNGPAWVELNLGNLCNLRCRMCNGDSSSSIASDPVHSHWTAPNSWVHPRWRSGAVDVLPRRIAGVAYEGFSELDWSGESAVVWVDGRAALTIPNDRREVAAVSLQLRRQTEALGVVVVKLDGEVIFTGSDVSMEVVHRLTDEQRRRDRLVLSVECQGRLGVVDGKLMRDQIVREPPPPSRFASGRKWFRDEAFLSREIPELSPNLTKLEFKGGEPFLIKEVAPLLQNLIDRGVAENVELVFATSGMIASGPVFDLLSSFGGLSIIFSLDGVGDLNDYIRHGSTWEEITRNMVRFRSLKNVALSMNTTVQAYNLLHLTSIAKFALDSGMGMSLNFLDEPEHLGRRAMPPPVLAEAKRRLDAFIVSHKGDKSQAFEQMRPALINTSTGLGPAEDRFDPRLLGKFVQFTRDLDHSRGQSFEAVNPELLAMIAQSGVA